MTRKFKRIFFATDLHGSDIVFRKFINAAQFYDVDALILGGDITGKLIVPIARMADGSYVSKYLDQDWKIEDQEQLATFERKVRNSGFYSYVASQDEFDKLKAGSPEVGQLFLKLMMDSLKAWVSYAEEKLGSKRIKCYVTGGNDDPFEVNEAFHNSNTVIDAEEKVLQLDESHEMISFGYSNPTPWKLPRDVPEERIAKELDKMAAKVGNMKNCFFNIHVPPKDTPLDQCQLLDSSVDPPRPVTKGGYPVIIGAGSKAVVDAINKYQPLAGLHGHIHESRGIVKIGRTMCFNPGSEYSEGVLKGALISFDQDKIVGYQLTSG